MSLPAIYYAPAPAGADVAVYARRAEEVGRRPYVVPPATSKAELLDGFARALHFPAWFGRNLDALADSMRDLSWLPEAPSEVIWDGAWRLRRADPATYDAVLDILREAAEASADGPRPLRALVLER